MKQDFLNYIQETFDFPPEEMEAFSCALSIPLKKTIRINTNKLSVEAFQKEAQKLGWRLSETSLGNNMCYIDRDDTTTALGNTLFHTNGYFYIQELAASSSPYYMSGDMVNPTPYTILDMSASPGGKTTQLAEYYSQSIIVANEIDKGRLKALYTNIDRMTAMSVVSTNYDGRFFKQVGELFDKVLLDAPCSGEGTGYKTDDALKYRNIKNIKRIAKLQFGLLEAAIQCCKPGGEIVYSTCTLNTIENEGVIEKALEKYGEYVELIRLLDNEEGGVVRNWPHRQKTGGFFVAKLRKIQSITSEDSKVKPIQQNFEKLSNTEEKMIRSFAQDRFGWDTHGYYLYKYKQDIYLTDKRIHPLWERVFLYRIGIHIGQLRDGEFEPNFFFGNILPFQENTIGVGNEEIDTLYHGQEIEKELPDGYYQLHCSSHLAGLAKIKQNKLKSLVPTTLIRK